MYVMGFSETPLHFIFRHKGDSVGRYRRYPLLIRLSKGGPYDLQAFQHRP